MNESIHQYLLSQVPESEPFFLKLEQYAKEHGVPIMEPDSIFAMLQIMQISKPKRILEIGTAIGYSALRMFAALQDVEITTMERDEERYEQARKNIALFGAEKNVKACLGDALVDTSILQENGPYDAIFIDAAKAQYEKFFYLYSPLLSQNGVIYSDNVLFKGLALELDQEAQKKARVARKMREFNEFLNKQSEFTTFIIPLGDGLGITQRKRKRGGKSE
ncbi:O-methyltransferase [Listeria sp. PSOL-1]|uniref:O-methyltransferase n=1 Tax=Listeria sp. PSOL-1 TaxID=1844999 RepID=UPI0013D64689|nr:O-methyltransferase [Listeria sp. PSOL-1]